MTINYLSILGEGVVNCIDTVKKGSVYYTTFINPGFVDNVTTKRFTCYVRFVRFSNQDLYIVRQSLSDRTSLSYGLHQYPFNPS